MQTVKITPFSLIGIAIKTTNENGQASIDIAELWQKFMSEQIFDKIPNKTNQEIYSLYTDYKSDHTKPYTAIIGCKVEHLKEIPDGLVGKSFAGGTYHKSSAKGDLTQGLVVNHWSKIFDLKLNRTFRVDFEVFGTKAQDPHNAEIDFYVGINDIEVNSEV